MTPLIFFTEGEYADKNPIRNPIAHPLGNGSKDTTFF